MEDYPANDVDAVLSLDRPPTPEEAAADFREALAELGMTPTALAGRLQRLGDRRALESISRGIQRMVSGATRVSGEWLALLEMLRREHRRARFEAANLEWTAIGNGCVTAKSREFTITLSAQSHGRWHVNLVHKDGYSPPWPKWQNDLESAKIRAVLCLDDGLADLQQVRDDNCRAMKQA